MRGHFVAGKEGKWEGSKGVREKLSLK